MYDEVVKDLPRDDVRYTDRAADQLTLFSMQMHMQLSVPTYIVGGDMIKSP